MFTEPPFFSGSIFPVQPSEKSPLAYKEELLLLKFLSIFVISLEEALLPSSELIVKEDTLLPALFTKLSSREIKDSLLRLSFLLQNLILLVKETLIKDFPKGLQYTKSLERALRSFINDLRGLSFEKRQGQDIQFLKKLETILENNWDKINSLVKQLKEKTSSPEFLVLAKEDQVKILSWVSNFSTVKADIQKYTEVDPYTFIIPPSFQAIVEERNFGLVSLAFLQVDRIENVPLTQLYQQSIPLILHPDNLQVLNQLVEAQFLSLPLPFVVPYPFTFSSKDTFTDKIQNRQKDLKRGNEKPSEKKMKGFVIVPQGPCILEDPFNEGEEVENPVSIIELSSRSLLLL